MDQARRQAVAFGGQQLDLRTSISTVWTSAAIRDEKAEIEVAKGRKELGVPTEQIWSELGYDAEKIREMGDSPEVQARTANQRMAVSLAGPMETGQ